MLTLKKYIPHDITNTCHTEILICTVSNVFPEKTPVNITVWQYNSNYPAMKTCFLLFPNWHSNIPQLSVVIICHNIPVLWKEKKNNSLLLEA